MTAPRNESVRIQYRDARPEDMPAMRQLIFEHGPNPWNYLPEDGVNAHLDNVETGTEWAVTAWAGNELVGFISYRVGQIFPQYEPEATRNLDHGYIVEGVVNRSFVGRGIGTALIEAAKNRLRERDMHVVYADRHEQNIASAALMEATGFEIVDTFPEAWRRTYGSRKTSVGRCLLL